ncbi:MAG: hypothetical protein J4G09_02105 [Proteobacteria bacterium]|nr:hypothetical protein [Pseudomonadota bacterium]
MLTRFDDYPIHQTPEPIAYPATSDRNAYGRYWFNGFARDGEFYFGVALGVYPNREVMDCALSIVRADGTQDCFRGSRRCPADRTEMRVGPFELQIVEPMRTLRVTIDDNRTGVSADVTFRGRTPAIEEPTDFQRSGIRAIMHTKRFTQFGTWEGEITAGGRRQEVDPARVYATRDRSWGWRGVGEPEGGAPAQRAPQVFWLWAPIHWEDECTHYGLFEYPDGRRWKEFAQVIPAYPTDADFGVNDESGVRELGAGEHRLSFEKGSRFASGAEIDLVHGADETETLRLEPLLRFHMIGIGYAHPEWNHGAWIGEEEITSESWNVPDLDRTAPKYQHLQQVVRVTRGDRVGHGVLEQIILGPHERYGLTGILDPVT